MNEEYETLASVLFASADASRELPLLVSLTETTLCILQLSKAISVPTRSILDSLPEHPYLVFLARCRTKRMNRWSRSPSSSLQVSATPDLQVETFTDFHRSWYDISSVPMHASIAYHPFEESRATKL